ncbi:PREDICTED: uncharacterized protein LOC105971425 isoform X2 [Erythranthe guttata]|uniref:uncharacterized protein LOC105971425 isoform X2 n=1 Tax=Erythranthe guttata TaxID=4155 RepID=UPI00064DB6C1|nr:PREDICTED: uncharacterized protein LOC105971425 isoform X2 [Erythranthe guttata]|eukprot:XP_012851733.1 PREDICTED: uncharacterized protein LOC105971425 isoform X2 [Erythranthe guttata]
MSSGARFKKVRKLHGGTSANSVPSTTRSASKDNTSSSSFPPTSVTKFSRPSGSNSISVTSGRRGNPHDFDAPTPNFEGSEPYYDEASTSIPGTVFKKNGRGVGRGLNLDKIVKQTGKMKIMFNPREKIPAQNEEKFSEGIGIAVRTCAELEGVSMWRQIPETNKEVCLRRLLQWFEIEDLTSERVRSIVDGMFQNAYRHWRNRLSECFNKLIDEGKNPREMSPREEVPIAKWLAVCDWLETDEFKERSTTNVNNKDKMLFSHTSGKIRYLSRYRKMENPNKIELWRKTHVDKAGQFVNSDAASAFKKMMELEEASSEDAENVMSEDQILVTTLGYRSGYQKGMGYGVEVRSRRKYSSNTRESESELQSARSIIGTLTTELAEQKEKNKSYEEKIETLQVQMQEMQQFFLKMQGNNTTQSSL